MTLKGRKDERQRNYTPQKIKILKKVQKKGMNEFFIINLIEKQNIFFWYFKTIFFYTQALSLFTKITEFSSFIFFLQCECGVRWLHKCATGSGSWPSFFFQFWIQIQPKSNVILEIFMYFSEEKKSPLKLVKGLRDI